MRFSERVLNPYAHVIRVQIDLGSFLIEMKRASVGQVVQHRSWQRLAGFGMVLSDGRQGA